MLRKVLVANRGEIACRVFRTARKLSIPTVAVYSDPDHKSLHLSLADEAFRLGPAPATESYLNGEKIMEIAKRSGATAIHPGYGFLSENAQFAEYCEREKITFIGPPASAIRAMGSKSRSKEIMTEASVPVVPGYHGEEQNENYIAEQARKIGFPVLIKAVLGGGGKGMKIVRDELELMDGIRSAKREALSSFKDDRILVEKYITRPRHVEIQVFADKHGNVVHLFERDCSVQRRHQKIIEEAPAPGLEPELRALMGRTAVAAAKAVGYEGAGTVEFIMDEDEKKINKKGAYYFMEMNTRLQVEHPVTECITGQDLVYWQFLVAAGHRLPFNQEQLGQPKGHAFEARIYAENPRKDFMPDTGKLVHLSIPEQRGHEHFFFPSPPTKTTTSQQDRERETLNYENIERKTSIVRVDTGVREGDEVSVFYDPMIAKLIVWDKDRTSALRLLKYSLDKYKVAGLSTNIQFLTSLCENPSFEKGDVHTGFIKEHYSELFPTSQGTPKESFALAALYTILNENTHQLNHEQFSSHGGQKSAWSSSFGFRTNYNFHRILQFLDTDSNNAVRDIHVTYAPEHHLPDGVHKPGTYTIQVDDHTKYHVRGELLSNSKMLCTINDLRRTVTIVPHKNELHIFDNDQSYKVGVPVREFGKGTTEKGSLFSPLPAKIVQLLVQPGDEVKQGQALIILEAMKMEYTIRAPAAGKVRQINYEPGTIVEEGKLLIVVD